MAGSTPTSPPLRDRAQVADPRWIQDLDATEFDAIRRAWRGGSLRPVKRAVERVIRDGITAELRDAALKQLVDGGFEAPKTAQS